MKNILLSLILFGCLIFDAESESTAPLKKLDIPGANTTNIDALLSVYSPEITYKILAPPEALYRHVPSITVSFNKLSAMRNQGILQWNIEM
jgi:hypothetical protein